MTPSLARITTSLIGGLVASVIAAAPGWAQSLPDWPLQTICSNDSAKGQCLLFEQRAKNDVAASWSILPETARTSCLSRFKPPLEPSWRILGDCVEVEGRRAQQTRAAARTKREVEALAQLSAPRPSAPTDQQPGAEQERQKQLAAQKTADQKRLADEEASFMARLAEQRRADKKAASAKAATKAAARSAEAERKRVEAEEASFVARLAEQRRADADAAKRKAAAKQQVLVAARAKAAQSCQARLRQIQSSGVIQFALNSADIAGSKGTALLDKLAEAASQCEGQLSITVEGHTDSQGAAAANNRLSQARAQTIADYLRNKGVPKERISALGFGSSKPIASNSTSAGRAKNRRIEFKVK